MRRREFLTISAGAIGATALYILSRESGSLEWQGANVVVPLRFFTAKEARVVSAACESLFPRDTSGPGATDAGVVIYIDRQLAGPYGRDKYRYVKPPFVLSVPEHGYQGKESPREIYRAGIRRLGNFRKLSTEEQIRKLKEIESSSFFQLLRRHTIEGMFCDPAMGVTPGWSAGRSSATRVRSGAIARTSINTSGRPGAPKPRRSSNSRDEFLRSWKMKATDATMTRLKPVDIVIVGGGFTGLTMAKELSTRTNLTVLVLERGRQRAPMEYAAGMDHIDFAARFRLMQNIADETVTHRHTIRDRSVPVRQYGSFLPGTGVGGAGEHWAGHSYRFTPEFFRLRGRLHERFGAARLPATLAVQDWGVTYDELEPHYWRAEQMLGVGGKAGNLRGRIVDGGDPFEGPRQQEFPLPPCKSSYFSALFSDATRQLGFHPFVTPSALLGEAYTNPDGIARPACEYCGYCSGFGCMVGAKARPTNTILPVLQDRPGFELRTMSWARRVCLRTAA